VEIFENEMNAIKIQFKDDTPSYIKLLRSGYMVLDDDVFIDARDTAYRKLINGEMKFTWYFKAFVLYRELIKVGLFKKEISELKQELYEGLQKAGEQATDYVDSVTLFWGYEVNPEDSDLQEFNSKTVEINRALLAKKEFNDFNKLIEDLNKNFQQFVIDVNGVYYNTPVFSYCNMDELSHKIIKLSNRNIGVMIDVFEKRYNDLRINSECRLELDNLKKLGSKFNTYIQSNELTPKTVLLKEFSNVIKNINSRI
ncbi:TPA: hypothetical protein QC295_005856, partial [Bacillus cereus]|nr:hypothetical protein [Bacillus cereus]